MIYTIYFLYDIYIYDIYFLYHISSQRLEVDGAGIEPAVVMLCISYYHNIMYITYYNCSHDVMYIIPAVVMLVILYLRSQCYLYYPDVIAAPRGVEGARIEPAATISNLTASGLYFATFLTIFWPHLMLWSS